jgi:hypothetical protein
MTSCPAKVTIIHKDAEMDDPGIVCSGKYYGDGRIAVEHDGHMLLVDPDCFNAKDPKRLMLYGESKWSVWRVRSVVLLIKKK